MCFPLLFSPSLRPSRCFFLPFVRPSLLFKTFSLPLPHLHSNAKLLCSYKTVTSLPQNYNKFHCHILIQYHVCDVKFMLVDIESVNKTSKLKNATWRGIFQSQRKLHMQLERYKKYNNLIKIKAVLFFYTIIIIY